MDVVRIGLASAAVMLVLSGCGGDEPTTGPADEPAAEVTEEAAPDAGAAGEGATVALGDTELGEVLVDADGMTLYVFEPDERSASTCYDECAASWPPLTVDSEPQAGEGVDAELLGTVARDDGADQVTYDGWPLYRWAGDDAPGDATGQGVNDVWWVLGPDASVLRDADAEQQAPASPAY